MKKVDAKVSFPKMEEDILRYWEENKIFEKSVEKESPAGDFVFYEGPPTANGKPGLHHVLARSFKDIIPRYKTMKGYRVARKAGWDTHGLPVELQVEKALGLKSKQEIENIVPGDARASVIEFNKKCKESVWEYRDLWEKMTKRMGYWVDMEHPYVTYENNYIESVWWQFAQVAELKNAKGESFVYKGHKVVPYCYRCGTALSSHEVAQGYKEVKDNAITVEFRMKGEEKISILAWTTTPWTLPGNVALAVNKDIIYSKSKVVEVKGESNFKLGETYIFAKDRAKTAAQEIFGGKLGEIQTTTFDENDGIFRSALIRGKDGTETQIAFESVDVKGNELLGLQYEPLYKTAGEKNNDCYRVIDGSSFVTTDSGTGIVHIAPAFGEDDANVARENDLPTVLTVEPSGQMVSGFGLPGEGIAVKKLNDKNRYAVDDLIIADLKERRLFFKEELYPHEYPFCWRCDTPLIYFAKPSWFIRMSELRDELVANNEEVVWVPEHIKEGRFGEWLRGVKDWAISRERYWGTPLPIWECSGENGCGKIKIISSITELEGLSGTKIDDVHKPYIDDVTFTCECGKTMRRVPEVLDVWFDSGAMPLAQFNYPQNVADSDKQNIEAGKYIPADYICEAIDQTRGWFYTLHALATLLHIGGKVPEGRAFRNVICLGHIMDAQGKKMSKSKGNVIDPFEMFDQYGADPLRWMLFSLNQPGMTKRFDVKGMRDVQNRVFRMLWNSYSFFVTYANADRWEADLTDQKLEGGNSVMDRWMLSRLQSLVENVDTGLERYDVYAATQKVESFLDDLSNWYIRQSRERFWRSQDDENKRQAYRVLHHVLITLVKLMAPFTPFVTEEVYRNLTGEASVHLAEYPTVDTYLIDTILEDQMILAREAVAIGLKKRAEAKIGARQPLESAVFGGKYKEIFEGKDGDYFLHIVSRELNIKGLSIGLALDFGDVILNTEITHELKLEGNAREIIRAIQEGRKKAGFNVEDRIMLGYQGMEKVFEMFGKMIGKEILAIEVKNEKMDDAEYEGSFDLDGKTFEFQMKRV